MTPCFKAKAKPILYDLFHSKLKTPKMVHLVRKLFIQQVNIALMSLDFSLNNA
jgi:hypothetical protein